MFTPWGAPVQLDRIEPGLTFVRTRRGGGVMISRGFAQARLSSQAQAIGTRFGEYFSYEMIHAWAAPLWELPEHWDYVSSTYFPAMRPDPREFLESILSERFPEYLAEVRVTGGSSFTKPVSGPAA